MKELRKVMENAERNGVKFCDYDLGFVTAKKGNYACVIDLYGDIMEIKERLTRLIKVSGEKA